MAKNQELDLSGISASLDELVKAADATDVVKAYGGVNIDSYGHVDESGKTPGGYADQGDVGGLDDMMIGKMQQALVEAGFSADAITAFMNGGEDEEGEEGEEGEDDEDEDEMEGKASFVSNKRPSAKMKGKALGDFRQVPASSPMPEGKPIAERPIGKSERADFAKAMDDFRRDPDIADAVDISPFLEALTARTADQLDNVRKSLSAQHHEQANVNRALAGALYQVGQLQKSMSRIVHALDKRLNLVERTPVSAPKGKTTIGQALTKSLPGEAGGSGALTKSEIISTLSYMRLEKGQREIHGRSTSEIIGMYEGGGLIDQGAVQAVQQFLATHPAEAETARTYR